MTQVKIFWDPSGFELDSVGRKEYSRITDGDTPYVTMSIRMLSIDTPEVHYPGNQKPSTHDDNLAQLADWIQDRKAPIHSDLGSYFRPRLSTGKAGTLQEEQGESVTKKFGELLEEMVVKPKRKVFLKTADEHFDQYGRVLAYMAPNYNASELASMTRRERATFNLLMVESGWAASFPIYPSLPKHVDLVMLQEAAKDAFESDRGAWADSKMLTGYEFRMCVRLYKITKKLIEGEKLSSKDKYSWISRFCVDMTTREVFYPQDYYKVEPYNRIFIWPKDVTEAVGKMNLIPEK